MLYIMYQACSLFWEREEIIDSINPYWPGITTQVIGCIKVGYTDSYVSRMNQYKTDCPNFQILYTYERGTREDEARLHKLFKQFHRESLISGGKEWFIADWTIVKFFERNDTIEDVRQELDAIESGAAFLYTQDPHVLDGHGKDFIRYSQKSSDVEHEIENSEWAQHIIDSGFARAFLDKDDPTVDELLKVHPFDSRYGLIPSDIYDKLDKYKPSWAREWQKIRKNIIKAFLTKKCPPNYLTSVELLNSNESFYAKYKWFCENKELTEEAKLDIMLNYLIDNINYSEWFRLFGSAGFIDLKFNEEQIALKYKQRCNSPLVKYLVSQRFHEGCIYSNVHIKNILQEIYKKAGLDECVPKPEGLSLWFDVRPCIITDSATKTPMNGLEIVSLKS